MSRFIDKLNQVSRVMPQSMGFRKAQPVSEKPKILLIASLAQASGGGLADYVVGADAGLLRIPKLSSGAKTLKEISQAAPDIPWGGWPRDINEGGLKQMAKAGCDFVVFPSVNTPLAIIEDEKTGKILQVEESLSEGLLATVNELPIDAVLMDSGRGGENFLTWHQLMIFQHFADLLAKPLLVSVPSNVTAAELQALWKAGVVGVVLEVEHGADNLNKLRQTIDKLGFSTQRKRKRPTALLPSIYTSKETETSTEEEEEEE